MTKILHIASLYCTGLRSSNITCNSVLKWIFDTAINMLSAFKVINTVITQVFCSSGTDQEEIGSSDLKKSTTCRILVYHENLVTILF